MEWPKHHLFPKAEKAFDKISGVAVAIGYLITHHLMYEGRSDHFRGASSQIDVTLYDQPNFDMDYHDPTRQNRWDSEGNWVNQDEYTN